MGSRQVAWGGREKYKHAQEKLFAATGGRGKRDLSEKIPFAELQRQKATGLRQGGVHGPCGRRAKARGLQKLWHAAVAPQKLPLIVLR